MAVLGKKISKEDFEKEKEFLERVKNIEAPRSDREKSLYEFIMRKIDETNAPEINKKKLKAMINALHPNIADINNLFLVSALNILFSKIIFIGMSFNPGYPGAILIPMLNLSDGQDTWLYNIEEAIIPFLLNSGILNHFEIKGVEKWLK